jgi:hypothetical protein
MPRADIVRRAFAAFRADADAPPPLTLRGGNAVDGYDYAEPYDPAQDEPSDAYLEGYAFWGIAYLDARSWRHYLPRLVEYAFRRPDDPAMVTEALLRSLRPPDRYPPRLATLTREQEAVVRDFLEELARAAAPDAQREEARQALAEWWGPTARLRPTPDEVAAARAAPVAYRAAGDGRHRLTLPTTFTGGGLHQIPEESRAVEVWGGNLCGDAPAVVAVNWTPLGGKSLERHVRRRAAALREVAGDARPVHVPGARQALRLDGWTRGDSPAEPQPITMLFAVVGTELATLTVRSWPRDDVAAAVERIVGSFEIADELAHA